MLSWLVRLKFGAKMAKLTPFGGLRGTKLAPKGALGAPKEAPREPQRATGHIGPAPRTLMLEARGPPKVS